jgi:hypothetical protein
MATFWLTFRIENRTVGGRSYDQRRDALYEAIRQHTKKWWLKPTSFVAFESTQSIDAIADACRVAIAESHDLFLIREMDTKSAIICGNNDDRDIYILMPYLKTLQ